MRSLLVVAALTAFALASLGDGAAQTPTPSQQPLTAEMFARDPAILSATLSPNGRYVAVLRQTDQARSIIIFDWRANQAVTLESSRFDQFLFIEWVAWKSDDRLLFSLHQRAYWRGRPHADSTQDVTRVYAVNRDGSQLKQMFEGQLRQLASDAVPWTLVDIERQDPAHVLLSTWGAYGFSLFNVDVNSGHADEVERMQWRSAQIFVDGQGNPVMRAEWLPSDSGVRYFRRAPGARNWVQAYEVRRASVAQNRDFTPLSAGPGAGQIYVAARPSGQEYQSLYLYNTATGELGDPVFQSDHADAEVVAVDPNDHSVLFGCGELQRWRCRAVDPHMQRHIDALSAYFQDLADFTVIDVSSDKKVWLLYVNGPSLPGTYYLYDLDAARVQPVGSEYPQLPRASLASSQVIHYHARDNADLWGYLTAPRTAGPHPLIVLPHGGPEARDSFAYDFFAQYFVLRGYAVFQPNFRGSEGSGRSFAEAGHHQWGRRMQDDVTDGVQHLIDTGVVDRNRMCIVGASYGGYVALAGAAFTPTLYKCAVSIAGVSDLLEMLNQERIDSGHGSVGYAYWVNLIGDPNVAHDELATVSPARHASAVQIPILLIHGNEDGTVPIRQSELMRDALQAAGKHVEYIRIEQEAHLWSNWTPEDRLRLLQETERFINANIGAH
ncbi:MAG: S9 family peptidase [Vitreimonas sp.]